MTIDTPRYVECRECGTIQDSRDHDGKCKACGSVDLFQVPGIPITNEMAQQVLSGQTEDEEDELDPDDEEFDEYSDYV